MKKEKDVIKEIIKLEKKLFDEECYLDEYEYTELQTLYSALDRDLILIRKG